MDLVNKAKKEIDELQQRFSLILENYVDDYVSYLKNSSNTEYLNNINHIKSVISNIDSQSFLLKNKMESEMQKIENKTSEFNIEIDALKKENKALKDRVKILDENVLTADGLFDNEIDLYKKQIVTIIVLLIGIIITCKVYYDLGLDRSQNMKVLMYTFIVAVVVYIFKNFYGKIKNYYEKATKLV
jgi:hypothetical protein